MNESGKPNQNSAFNGQHIDYLKRAADACEEGDTVLGMHLYLAAYEMAVADPSIPDGMALAGLREAWHLACELKERSMAEYVFEKLEPYLTGDEIAACAGKLQSLALDRLEEYGFSREELEDMAEMISQDLIGVDASVVKVESISIPHVSMFGLQNQAQIAPQAGIEDGDDDSAPSAVDVDAQVADAGAGQDDLGGPDDFGASEPLEPSGQSASDDSEAKRQPGIALADVNDFNPYDMYRDYSIGKSWHSATNEGSGAAIFTRDADRAAAHEKYVADSDCTNRNQDVASADDPKSLREADDARGEDACESPDCVQDLPTASKDARIDHPDAGSADGSIAKTGSDAVAEVVVQGVGIAALAGKSKDDLPTMPNVAPVDASAFNYRSLAGYDEAVAVMRDYGVGLQNDRGFRSFIAMLNERHGLDRAPALDTFLFRAPVLEDAARFVEATIGELGLPALRMSMEEGVQGMPVLCIMTQGNHRPRMNHAHNRFEAPAILVLQDLDMWYMPQAPEGIEGMAGFMMANISRGAREAVNLIRSAVEDPDVYVLATATTSGEVDPFFYDVLEPLTVVDIGNPSDKERTEIWTEIARNHPSMRLINRADLMRFSQGMSRYDIYIAARDAIEEAYKLGIVQRSYVAVSPLNIFEKLAACQPLESEEYRALEERIIASFQRDLDKLDDLIDGSKA